MDVVELVSNSGRPSAFMAISSNQIVKSESTKVIRSVPAAINFRDGNGGRHTILGVSVFNRAHTSNFWQQASHRVCLGMLMAKLFAHVFVRYRDASFRCQLAVPNRCHIDGIEQR